MASFDRLLTLARSIVRLFVAHGAYLLHIQPLHPHPAAAMRGTGRD
jgi:hypothetical protein